ncbi:MAG: hypothetical protein ACYCYI_13435, partial [Saccharofermentanales bacterium]
ARDKMFVNPPSEYRVIDLLPGIRLPITEMVSKNMGGALTSVNWGDDYLNNDLSWYALNQDLTKLANAKMTAWIWDEKGFPSGAAGGLAVEGKPELESRGVFKVSIAGEGTGHREISLPSDSVKFLSAVLYPVTGGAIKFDKGTPAVFTDTKASTNGMSGKWELWVATESILLEGGGSVEEAGKQFHTSGRYPNLMSRDAVRSLIDVSYKKYQSKVENFSDRIYAFLAGEPNLQVIYAYTNNPRKNGRAYFAWEKSIPSIYRQKYGSDLIPVLPLMLGGDQEVNKRLRYQYYTIVGDLVSENFSGQITQFSESAGSKASAYLFGQDSMSIHVWLYGNYMQVLGKYSIPAGEIGIASHENFSNLDFSGMKYITSAARMNGKYKSMIYMDPLMGGYTGTIKIGSDVLIRNMNMEAHYGFNMFGTYGHYNNSSAENYSKYNTYAGRLGVMLQDAVDKSETAIFYPIETFQGRSIPTKEHYYNVTTPYADIETVQNDLVNALSNQSIDYNFIDANSILKAPIKNKAMTIGKNSYKVIVMPAVELIDYAVIQKLNAFEAAGGKVIYYQTRPSIATKANQNAALKSAVSGKMIATSMVQVIPLIKNTISDNVTIDATTMVVYSQYVKDSRQLVFIVNTLGVDGTVTINIGGAKKARIINPDTGSIDNVTLPHRMDIGGYKSLFVEVTS